MKKILLLLTACLLGIGRSVAGNVLTADDVSVPQGGEATLEIGCEFDTEYTAFELQIALPEGVTLKSDADGYPIIEKAFATNHVLTGNLLPSNGNYKITCRSMENLSMPTSGALFRVTLVAAPSIALGTSLNASITASEFTRTFDSQGESLDDVNFMVNISEFRTILDETSTTHPVAETNANVRVRRAIKANEWSTICLPFAMSEAQVKTAFGDDVQLADFKGYDVKDNGESISVRFADVTAIEKNHPYIIKVGADVAEFTVDGVDVDPEEEPMINFGTKRKPKAFVGNYVAGTAIENGCLFLSDNKFWYSVGTTTIKGFRGYFNFDDLLPDFEDNYAAARVMMMFNDDDVVTGIDASLSSKGERRYYNLGGQRISHPKKKGLYIQKGKKLIVK